MTPRERESSHELVVEHVEQARESATRICACVERISDSVTRFKAAEKAKR